MRPDPDKVFATRAEAESARDRLNDTPPEWGWSPWYLDGPDDCEWWMVRSRGVIAEDLAIDASAYEQAFREIIRRSSHNRDYWREAVGIHIEDVYLDGSYPDTDARAFIVRGARPCHPDAINWLR